MNKCRQILKSLLLPLLLSILVFGFVFGPGKPAKADTEIWGYACADNGVWNTVSQNRIELYVPTENTTITQLGFSSTYVDSGTPDVYFTIIESNSSGYFIGDIATSTTRTLDGAGGTHYTVNFETPPTLTAGHYYFLIAHSSFPWSLCTTNENTYPGVWGQMGDVYSWDMNPAHQIQDNVDSWKSSALQLYVADTPTITDLVYVFGWPNLWSNPSIFQPNSGVKQFPIFWNACASYNDFDHASIVPDYNGTGAYHPGTAVIYPKASFIGPQQCKGNYIYYDTFDTSTSGYVNFNMFFYDAAGNIIATTTSNTVDFTTATSTGTFISNIDSDPLNIDLGSLPEYGQTQTTTTLSFMYNFVGENTASTTVYLWDYVNATSTGYTYSGPFISTSTSWASIEIPTPSINTFKTYKFIAVRPGFDNLVSPLFGVNWNFTPIPLTPDCNPPNYDITRICDGLATGPLPDYILGDLLCGVKYGLVAAGQFMFQPNCDSLSYITDNYDLFKRSFPFNTYFDLTDSINTAINTATSSTSTIGALSMPFIRNTATSTEYYMMPVMNATSVSNTIGTTNYNTYKMTLGYIWWLLGAAIVYITIRKV